jgi:hypothetical protein
MVAIPSYFLNKEKNMDSILRNFLNTVITETGRSDLADGTIITYLNSGIQNFYSIVFQQIPTATTLLELSVLEEKTITLKNVYAIKKIVGKNGNAFLTSSCLPFQDDKEVFFRRDEKGDIVLTFKAVQEKVFIHCQQYPKKIAEDSSAEDLFFIEKYFVTATYLVLHTLETFNQNIERARTYYAAYLQDAQTMANTYIQNENIFLQK